MTLPKEHLEYPVRRYGMDHELYDWSLLVKRKNVQWPNGARIALWVTASLEFFPLDQPAKPFKAPGGMVTPYPDLRHYTTRDYGNRVGIQRIWRVLDKYKNKIVGSGELQTGRALSVYRPKLVQRGDESLPAASTWEAAFWRHG